ncbi:MAG: hypothetical protein KatS3mg085_207 [Candidatus Dojkabacteria bacterium]|nr:MAG: hypothetical protein KatS3mg085_207 [Candidatus Dojkabacteria bacterium]
MKFKTIFLQIFLFFLLLFSLTSKVNAQELQIKNIINYEVSLNGLEISQITQFYTSQNIIIPKNSTYSFTIPLFLSEVQNLDEKAFYDSIEVTDNLGSQLDFTVENLTSEVKINVKIKTTISKNSNYTINLKYKIPNYVIKSGRVLDVYVPIISNFENEIFDNQFFYKIFIDKTLGDIISTSILFQITEEKTSFVLEPYQNSTGQLAYIQIGEKQIYKFTIKQEYPKTSKNPYFFNKLTLPLPRDIEVGNIKQSVFYSKFNIEPDQFFLDKDENLIASFKVPSNEQGIIEIEGFVILEKARDISTNWGKLNDIPQSLNSATTSVEFWEANDPEIQKAAKTITSSDDIYEISKKTYEFVVDKIDYSTVKKYGLNERQGAVATLKGSAAVCMEYSDLFIALMRARKIPARGAFGYGYNPILPEKDVLHQWADVYAPALNSWIPVDTTWGEYGREIIGGDFNHVYFYVSTQSPNTPSPIAVEYFGAIDEIKVPKFEVIPIENFDSANIQSTEELLTKFDQPKPYFHYIKKSFATIGQNFFEIVGLNNYIQPKYSYTAGLFLHASLFFALILIFLKVITLLLKLISISKKLLLKLI